MKNLIVFLLLATNLVGCISGGTHGYIKMYHYNTSKYELEKAVNQVISKNSNVIQDSIKDYYNDDTAYLTISILEEKMHYTYTFRYYGGTEYWSTSKTSAIFIAYAHDPNSKGGSSGNGGIKWYNFDLKKRLTEPFERELINKIDSVLVVKHTEE